MAYKLDIKFVLRNYKSIQLLKFNWKIQNILNQNKIRVGVIKYYVYKSFRYKCSKI